MIPFNRPFITSLEEAYMQDALKRNQLSGDGFYTHRVVEQFKSLFGIEHLYLTSSGTDALEMASVLLDLQPGDEIIVPSFTFSSTVNAPMLRGAKPVFVDIRKDTLNLDEKKIEALITPRTKAIYVVDYAGVPAAMDEINELSKRYSLAVVEDAAQAVGSTYKGHYCGTLSELGCFSFHATKNYCMGEGGALIANEPGFLDRADIIREKGTDRRRMLSGLVDKYTWQDIGSSYLPSDLLASLLSAQMERYKEIFEARMKAWNRYHENLKKLEEKGFLRRPIVPKDVTHNAHMYYILLRNQEEREGLRQHLYEQGVSSVIHYIPLHSSPFGQSLGFNKEDCPVTEDVSARLLRLPMFGELTIEDVDFICNKIESFKVFS